MTDWDALLKTASKGNGFIGTTRADEDAYFAAFADEPQPFWAKLHILAWCRAVLSQVRAARLL